MSDAMAVKSTFCGFLFLFDESIEQFLSYTYIGKALDGVLSGFEIFLELPLLLFLLWESLVALSSRTFWVMRCYSFISRVRWIGIGFGFGFAC
jgi:hypothetical protein